jgi:hypothetical protein
VGRLPQSRPLHSRPWNKRVTRANRREILRTGCRGVHPRNHAEMDDSDLEKAAARLRQQQRAAAAAAGTPPPPAASRHRDSLPSEASPPARRASGWNARVRPVPTLVELCTRSLCETKLACVSPLRCALAACVAALCLPACLEVASSHLGAFGSTDIASWRCVVCACCLHRCVWMLAGVGVLTLSVSVRGVCTQALQVDV